MLVAGMSTKRTLINIVAEPTVSTITRVTGTFIAIFGVFASSVTVAFVAVNAFVNVGAVEAVAEATSVTLADVRAPCISASGLGWGNQSNVLFPLKFSLDHFHIKFRGKSRFWRLKNHE